MSDQLAQQAVDFLADHADVWQVMKHERPFFIKGGEAGDYEGPFLYRGDRLLPISERAAWALLRVGNAYVDKEGNETPVHFPTYSAGVSLERIKSMSNFAQYA